MYTPYNTNYVYVHRIYILLINIIRWPGCRWRCRSSTRASRTARAGAAAAAGHGARSRACHLPPDRSAPGRRSHRPATAAACRAWPWAAAEAPRCARPSHRSAAPPRRPRAGHRPRRARAWLLGAHSHKRMKSQAVPGAPTARRGRARWSL